MTASAPALGSGAGSAARTLWLVVDFAIVLAFLNPLWSPAGTVESWFAVVGVLALRLALGFGSLAEWRRTLRWFALPLAGTLALRHAPSAPLAMALPVLGIVAGVGIAWTIARSMLREPEQSDSPRSLRWVLLGAVAFLGYAAYSAGQDDSPRSRTGIVASTGERPEAQPSEFDRTQTLRLGPTNSLAIPGTFAGCEVKIRAVTAWNAILEVAWFGPAENSHTSFFLGTDPRVRTGFAIRADSASAVEPIGVSGFGRQPYQRLDITLRRVDGRLTAFVVDRFDGPEAQRKQEASAIAWAEADSGLPSSITLLAAKGVFDVERVEVRPLENSVTTAARPLTWRSRTLILPLALVLLVLSAAYACRTAAVHNPIEGFLFVVLAFVFLRPHAFGGLIDIAWRMMVVGTLLAALGALPALLGPRRSLLPTLTAALGAIVAFGAYAYVPELVDGRSLVRFGSLHDWRGRSYEPDLAFLRHPTMRAQNRYYDDHTFHGEVAAAVRTPDAKRIVVVGDDSWLERTRNHVAPIATQLDVYLSAYLKVAADGPIREIECLDATTRGREPSNLPALVFCERTLLVRANPPEDATGKPWRGPDTEALAPDAIVFLVSTREMPDGSLELLESQVGPNAFRNWFDELGEELDLGRRSEEERLRQLVKPLIRLAGTVSTAQAATGRPCRLVFVLPPRPAQSGAIPFVNSYGLFQVLAPVLPNAAADGKPCFGRDGGLTEHGQRLLARTLALLLAPQFAGGGAR